jgi:hypothetical protein
VCGNRVSSPFCRRRRDGGSIHRSPNAAGGLYISFILDIDLLHNLYPVITISLLLLPPLLSFSVSGELAILEEGENSTESSPDPKLAAAENEKWRPKRKREELDSQNCSQRAQESPQAIAGGRQVPKVGELALQPRNRVCRERSNLQHFYWWRWLWDRDRDRNEPELPPRHDDASDFHVYEFDLQRSSGRALLGMYMSLKFAVRGWGKAPFSNRTANTRGSFLVTFNQSGVEFPHGGKHATEYRVFIDNNVGRGSLGASTPARYQ